MWGSGWWWKADGWARHREHRDTEDGENGGELQGRSDAAALVAYGVVEEVEGGGVRAVDDRGLVGVLAVQA